MVNQNIVFNSAFSLHSLLVFIFSLLLTSDPAPPSTKKEQNVEIGFGSRWRSVLGMGHGGDCVWGSRWRLCLRLVLGFSCLSLFSSLGFNSGGSWCFSGGAVAWIGCRWWVFWLGLNWCWDWLVFMGILAQAAWARPLRSSSSSSPSSLPLWSRRSLSFLVVVCFNFWCRGWYWL